MSWFTKLERKFSRYAIPNLIDYILVLYGLGLFLAIFNSGFYETWLALDFGKVLQGQIWRLLTFIIYPPDSSLVFILLTFYVYYMMGHALENCWGTVRFNLFFLSGILFHILAGILTYFIFGQSFVVGTYYLNLSMMLAFITEFPDIQFLLFFILPIKAKWIGIIDAVYLGVTIVGGFLAPYLPASAVLGMLRFGIVPLPIYALAAFVSVLNFLLFFFLAPRRRISPKQVRRRVQFNAQLKSASPKGKPRHKCAVCGRTELDDENLEFRYCSKCEGSYEYCQEHLYTHKHVGHDENQA